jgi:hypothetical protein
MNSSIRRIWALMALVALIPNESRAAPATTYRYDLQTRASDFARGWFGPLQPLERSQNLNMGNARIGVSTELDCGKLDIRANIRGEFNKLQEQVKGLIPRTADDVTDLVSRAAMITTCYAYPTVCAQLRHDFLALQANLNLRSQACRAIDSFIDSQADKGAKQLRAESQAQCVSEQIKAGTDPSTATANCQSRSGLPIRDFTAGLEKRFTRGKQKVLWAIVDFAKDKPAYPFVASLLGEIEVQEDGYWQPLFTAGMLRPNDAARNVLAVGEEMVCQRLAGIIYTGRNDTGDIVEQAIADAIRRRLSFDDVQRLEDLTPSDKQLACAALGRAVGKMAAERVAARGEAVVASGLLNSAIPNSLREEYRNRSDAGFLALRRALEVDQIPSLDEVRAAVAQLAQATRERNRVIASQVNEARVQNSRSESTVKSDCTDTLSCSGGQP